MRVVFRVFEFGGELREQRFVEEVFDAVGSLIEMVVRQSEVPGHVGLPETVRPDELLRCGAS